MIPERRPALSGCVSAGQELAINRTPDLVAHMNADVRRQQSVALAGAVLVAIFAVDPGYDGPCPGTGLGDDVCPACGHPNTRRHAVEQVTR